MGEKMGTIATVIVVALIAFLLFQWWSNLPQPPPPIGSVEGTWRLYIQTVKGWGPPALTSVGTTTPSGWNTVNVNNSITVTAYPSANYYFIWWCFETHINNAEVNTFNKNSTITIPPQPENSTSYLYAVFYTEPLPYARWD
jgi:hypothetical protein